MYYAGSKHKKKKKTQALTVASEENGLDVNAEKNK
jgi:hypothetical protein